MSLPSLTDLKIHLNKTTTTDDDELADVLDAAVDVVENIVGSLQSAEVTEKHYGVASPTLLLRRMPVGEVTAVSISTFGYAGATELPLANYDLDSSAGVLRVVDGGWFSGDYTVTYTAGRDSLPAAIRLAVLIVAGHLWDLQRGPSPVGPLAAQDDTFATPGVGFAIPNRARELLAPYLSSGSIA